MHPHHQQSHKERPPINPNRLAEHKADQAYKTGAWLKWYLDSPAREADTPPTDTEYAVLGGTYDDRALQDEGLDGTILARGEDPLVGTSDPSLSSRVLMNKATPDEQTAYERKRRLDIAHTDRTSPVVREPARLLSNEDLVDYEEDPRAHVWTFGLDTSVLDQLPDNDKVFNRFALPFGGELQLVKESRGFEDAFIQMDIPEGYRLIVKDFPKGGKYDKYPYTEDNPLPLMEVQMYHNSEGYLIADKVFPGGGIAKKHAVSVIINDDGTASIDNSAPQQRAMDSLWAHNSRKSEHIDPLDPSNNSVFLLSTTSTRIVRKSTYDQAELTIETPDDSGNTVWLTIENLKYFDSLDAPTQLILVPDTARPIAPAESQ